MDETSTFKSRTLKDTSSSNSSQTLSHASTNMKTRAVTSRSSTGPRSPGFESGLDKTIDATLPRRIDKGSALKTPSNPDVFLKPRPKADLYLLFALGLLFMTMVFM